MDNEFIPKSEFNEILDAIHDEILIVDADGVIVHASKSFEDVYGVKRSYAIGKTVYQLEDEGFFKPSISAIVLEKKEKVTMPQKNKAGRDIVVTASPVHDENGNIKRVVSFSRDVTDYFTLKKQYSKLEAEVGRYKTELEKLRSETVNNQSIISVDAKTKEIMNTISRIGAYDTNVLITGESGVGKSLYAKTIHLKSPRADGPYIDINCGAIPENLLESELFGYERGTFTGALESGKVGLIESANEGTLFLDEIGELPSNLQVKLLKVIQNRVITKVGSVAEVPVDFRLISATNQNLETLMKNGLFRDDLFYRLNVISIDVPPLRERKADILPMISFFVDKINAKHTVNKSISGDVLGKLVDYDWPGNIRELENVLERLLLTSDNNVIVMEDFERLKLRPNNAGAAEMSSGLNQAVEDLESRLVAEAFQKTGTTVGVAKELKISQPTAARKVQKYVKKL